MTFYGLRRYLLVLWPHTAPGVTDNVERLWGVTSMVRVKPLTEDIFSGGLLVDAIYRRQKISLDNCIPENIVPDTDLPRRSTVEELAVAVLCGDQEAALALADEVLMTFHSGRRGLPHL